MVTELGMATERQVAEALAQPLGLRLVDLGRTAVSPENVRLLPRAVADRSGVMVLDRDGTKLTVATSDPTNVFALDDVKLYTGATELTVVVATVEARISTLPTLHGEKVVIRILPRAENVPLLTRTGLTPRSSSCSARARPAH